MSPIGCDIHLYVEVLVDGRWKQVRRSVHVINDDYFGAQSTDYALRWADWRNYDSFAMLANVRNGYGFAGVDTGTGFMPITTYLGENQPARGFPENASESVEAEYRRWGVDAHTPSWFTLEELISLDEGYWGKTTEVHAQADYESVPKELIVKEEEGILYLSGSPEYYSSAIWNSKGDIRNLVWDETYRESGRLILKLTDELKETAESVRYGITPKDAEGKWIRPFDLTAAIRIVFWFDN